MSLKLRDLIRSVRSCRSAAEERALVAKECADIRTSFRAKDEDHLRHRNVAKLLYIHMLGYPTHFGQMEAMKLLASPRYAEKRIGYLALMLLMDENQELLMLATNSMKQDIHSSNPYIAGLALCALANIASASICRDLSLDVADALADRNSYIRKKALLCALRVIRRVPDLAEDFLHRASDLLSDSVPSVKMTAIFVMTEIVHVAPQIAVPVYRPLIPQLCKSLHTCWTALSSSANPHNVEYDIFGIFDPFLQVNILKFLRLISLPSHTSRTNEFVSSGPIEDKYLDTINEILSLFPAAVDASSIPGVAIHYEAILTTLTISNDSVLRTNAIVQLGKFLQSKDNNIRYISLNTMYQVAQQQIIAASTSLSNAKGVHLRALKQKQQQALANLEVIQRHRNIVVAYLKDHDSSIRKRALSLVYALVTEKNVRPLVRELLMYLALKPREGSDSGSVGGANTSIGGGAQPNVSNVSGTAAGGNTNHHIVTSNSAGGSKSQLSFTNIPSLVRTNLPYAGGSSFSATTAANGASNTISMTSSNTEFKCDLTHKIYYIVYQYAPNTVWQVHNMLMLLSTDNEFINETIFYEFVSLITNFSKPQYSSGNPLPDGLTKRDVDAFLIYELFHAVNHSERMQYAFLVQAFFFFLGVHSDKLFSAEAAQNASRVSAFLVKDSAQGATTTAESGAAATTTTPQSAQPQYEHNVYSPLQPDQLANLISAIMQDEATVDTTKQLGLTCITRLLILFTKSRQPKATCDILEYNLRINRVHHNIDLQQRATEYLTMLQQATDTGSDVARKLLFPLVTYQHSTFVDFSEDGGNSALTSPGGDANDANDAADDSQDGHESSLPTQQQQQQQQQPEVDVFAKLNNPDILEQAATTTTASSSVDLLSGLLADTPSNPTNTNTSSTQSLIDILTQPSSVAAPPKLSATDAVLGLYGNNNISSSQQPQQQQQQQQQQQPPPQQQAQAQPQAANFDLFGSMLNNNNNNSSTSLQPTQPSPLSTIAPLPPTTTTAAASTPTPAPFDLFGSMESSSPTSPTLSPPSSTSTTTTTTIASQNNNNDPFATLGSSPSQSSSSVVQQPQQPQSPPQQQLKQQQSQPDDDFESAPDDDGDDAAALDNVVYNQQGIVIQVSNTNQPLPDNSGISYVITLTVSLTKAALASNTNVSDFKLLCSIRPPLRKTIKVADGKVLSAASPLITQEVLVENPNTTQPKHTSFRAMFKCTRDGSAITTEPFDITV